MYLVDRLVVGHRLVPRLVGRDTLAPFQNGLIQFYAAASALGVAVLLLLLVCRIAHSKWDSSMARLDRGSRLLQEDPRGGVLRAGSSGDSTTRTPRCCRSCW